MRIDVDAKMAELRRQLPELQERVRTVNSRIVDLVIEDRPDDVPRLHEERRRLEDEISDLCAALGRLEGLRYRERRVRA